MNTAVGSRRTESNIPRTGKPRGPGGRITVERQPLVSTTIARLISAAGFLLLVMQDRRGIVRTLGVGCCDACGMTEREVQLRGGRIDPDAAVHSTCWRTPQRDLYSRTLPER